MTHFSNGTANLARCRDEIFFQALGRKATSVDLQSVSIDHSSSSLFAAQTSEILSVLLLAAVEAVEAIGVKSACPVDHVGRGTF